MPQQVQRLVIVFVVAIGSLVGARHIMTPESFGKTGHYRAAAIDSVLALPIRYAGEQVCLDCHDDIGEMKIDSNHAGLACEVCHAPAAGHADDPDTFLPPAPRQRGYCPLCHGYNPSRPSGFPQIDPVSHNPVQACVTCHDPHAPEPPDGPAECQGCHQAIVRTKAVSHHAKLPCARCHANTEEHRASQHPRELLPDKPRTRALCGECHASADVPREIPRIGLDSHEPKYLCWQCHYPHHPEAK